MDNDIVISVEQAELPVVNWSAVMEICSDEDTVRRIAEAIRADGSESLNKIREAIEQKDAEQIQLYAHRLKGAAGTIGAGALVDVCYRLECAGEQKDVGLASELVVEVESKFDRLVSFLSKEDWVEMAKSQRSF